MLGLSVIILFKSLLHVFCSLVFSAHNSGVPRIGKTHQIGRDFLFKGVGGLKLRVNQIFNQLENKKLWRGWLTSEESIPGRRDVSCHFPWS